MRLLNYCLCHMLPDVIFLFFHKKQFNFASNSKELNLFKDCLLCSLIHIKSHNLEFNFWYFQEICIGHFEYPWVQVMFLNNLILHAGGNKAETV